VWPGRTEGSPEIHTLWHRKNSATGTLNNSFSNKKMNTKR
jgi:hypothetical protein